MAQESVWDVRADGAGSESGDRAQRSRDLQGSIPTTRFSLGPKVPITPWGMSQRILGKTRRGQVEPAQMLEVCGQLAFRGLPGCRRGRLERGPGFREVALQVGLRRVVLVARVSHG